MNNHVYGRLAIRPTGGKMPSVALPYSERIGQQVDATLIELLRVLASHHMRPAPFVIDELRVTLARGLIEITRPINDNAKPPRGEWEDEPTQPERPSQIKRRCSW